MERDTKGVLTLCAVLMGAPVGAYVLSDWHYQLGNPGRMAAMLNIAVLPASVRNANCDSSAITDIYIDCRFDFDPTDLPLLVGSRTWKTDGYSYWFSIPKKGRPYPAEIKLNVGYPAGSDAKLTYLLE